MKHTQRALFSLFLPALALSCGQQSEPSTTQSAVSPSSPGTTETLVNLKDWGSEGRRWYTDFNGDGFTDYCRATSRAPGQDTHLTCSLGTRDGLQGENDIEMPVAQWGNSGTWLVDVNGDRRADLCQLDVQSPDAELTCSFSNGTGFSFTTRSPFQAAGHFPERRWLVDANADGRADFCRNIGASSGAYSYLVCNLSVGTTLAPKFDTYLEIPDWGTAGNAWFVDVDGDRKPEVCRVDSQSSGSAIGCYLTSLQVPGALAPTFKTTFVSADVKDLGYNQRRWLTDMIGDRRADYCRAVGSWSGPGSEMACVSLAWDGQELRTNTVDPYYHRAEIQNWGPSDRQFWGSGFAIQPGGFLYQTGENQGKILRFSNLTTL